ncbi:hypothetical protein C2G38_2154538 [Gigaspora rosea]|uniref:Uncharacterized protein n=1 Tax=Gigaspora rosea TaxID=44941 RepID=A0A397W8R5_9GLOM|nr:hypothetical protein C2G38_2154538 [Gigaspora rosea]
MADENNHDVKNQRKSQMKNRPGNTLADALSKNITLITLNISDNELESEGGKALADSLYVNITLSSLNLSDNELGSEGGKSTNRYPIGEDLKCSCIYRYE